MNNPGVEGYLMPNMHACMYVCMYVCMAGWMYVWMHVWMHVCVCMRVYACMHACIHACIYIYGTPPPPKIYLFWFFTGIYWGLQQVGAFLQNLIFEEGDIYIYI